MNVRRLLLSTAALLFACGVSVATCATARADCDRAVSSSTIFFITDRKPVSGEPLFAGERGIDAARAPIVTYGVLGHDLARDEMHLCSSSAVFFRAVGKRFPNALNRRVLIYTHGYYRTFVNGAATAFALQKALAFPGPVILYSWPSKVTSRLSYINDESNALWSVSHFVDVLGRLERAYPLLPVSFVSHSMGARLATAGVQYFRYSHCIHCLGRSIFMAPDIDSATLHDEFVAAGACSAVPVLEPAFAATFTLYVSNRDKALRSSQQLHGHQRAGQAGSELILCNGVDTIDVSYLGGSDRAGHSYQSDPAVLADTAAALIGGVSPSAAPRKLVRAQRAGGIYYEFATTPGR